MSRGLFEADEQETRMLLELLDQAGGTQLELFCRWLFHSERDMAVTPRVMLRVLKASMEQDNAR